jgi:hypothetical protein
MRVVSGLRGNAAAARTEPRLPVWRTSVEAYALTISNFGYLLRISWAWALLMIPVSLGFYACIFWFGWHNSASVDVLSTLLFQPFLASIAVAWHRRVLANEEWPRLVYMRLDRLVAAYLGLDITISFLSLGPIIIVISGLVAGWHPLLLVAAALAVGVGLFLSTKIWLALPAVALGNSAIAVRQAWRRSSRNVGRLIAGSILSSFVAVVLFVVVAIFGPDVDKATQPLIYATWQTLLEIGITFLAGMPVVSFLSLAYLRLIQDRG